jgi:hypothetical protein
MSGARNPYPGKLGVVEKGALADLLIVDGNPLEDIDLIADPEKNFVLIIRMAKYKRTSRVLEKKILTKEEENRCPSTSALSR